MFMCRACCVGVYIQGNMLACTHMHPHIHCIPPPTIHTHSPPFTIQRVCELIVDPLQHYKRRECYMRAMEKVAWHHHQ